MILGTASSVGKSVITAGLCRLFSNRGYRVAPFKAQNMSNNACVTSSGGEIGRAQAVQAECARIEKSVDLNPILLKPAADNRSQVIVLGKPVGHFTAREYYERLSELWPVVCGAYARLAQNYDVIIMEGAGSPAEINLKKHDVVNMKAAAMADAGCYLVGDIDRGGVFAALVGTLALLEPADCSRIKGFIINKFRGDETLLEPGIQFLRQRTGVPVVGVLPYLKDLYIDEEDAVSLENQSTGRIHATAGELDIAVVALPRISNFTDFDILAKEQGVCLRYVRRKETLGTPDLLIIPGTKSTVADLAFLRRQGWCEKILEYVKNGGRILGICGGYQMMGRIIRDTENIESEVREAEGLGFFDMVTEFSQEKILKQSVERVSADLFGSRVEGEIRAYEIHMGRTVYGQDYKTFGAVGRVDVTESLAGTYYHGLFDQVQFRLSFLRALAAATGKNRAAACDNLTSPEFRDTHYERLSKMLEVHLDWESLQPVMSGEKSACAE
ncbi:MAG: cobyric acid synthase CobQ [Omnitrophica bacterium GWA2_52_8]|nr:MAG: cobyric acid synthase CobQ [Omnitrophica bacterium GWA2_52_8]